MNSLDKNIVKLVCTHCKVINDEDITVYFVEPIGSALFMDGFTICWYCKKPFGWKLSEETIDKLLGNKNV